MVTLREADSGTTERGTLLALQRNVKLRRRYGVTCRFNGWQPWCASVRRLIRWSMVRHGSRARARCIYR